MPFLNYNSRTAGPILDPKVALERQFGGLSLKLYLFFYSAQNERTTRQLLRKIRFREKRVLTLRRCSVGTGGRRGKKIHRKIPLQIPYRVV